MGWRMKRGDIYFAQLDPTLGSEIQKTRPVVIVSNDSANRASSLVTVVPLSSSTSRVFPFEVLLESDATGLNKSSKAMAQHVRTLNKARLSSKRSGVVSSALILVLDDALRLHLSL